MLRISKRRFSIKINCDFEPHSIITPLNNAKKKVKIKRAKSNDVDTPKNEEKCNHNVNEMGIQMIAENLHRQIFGNVSRVKFNSETIEKYRKELHAHGITNLETPALPDVNLKLPKLHGSNIEEHFYNISKQQVGQYQSLIDSIVTSNLPIMPKVSFFFLLKRL
jgi:DNA polymerase gamma 1